ncbi:complement component 1 Q subcomponent-binding protein, mitochondrial-like [Ruditapes philippinarum]|uniref:complement component 1 Q subcomponent-binding protein, mitochondrial-like n=1 Tax=Ruditapes philippinarum TaxID=129788 RepID=UPI00295BEF59|nr:complement component 1 Q subcomponent-binding protein, mitochondrial-like [Ruditapes philippinarum]
MASSLRQPVLALTSKFLQIAPKTATVPVAKSLTPHFATRGLTLSLSRNLWIASNNTSILNRSKHIYKHGKVCGCCSVHTEVDEKLASFLDQEIASESKTEASIDTIDGWDIKTDGTGVILTKKFNDEIIKIEFDVNDTVDNEAPFSEGADLEAPALVSRPPFDVQITKKSGKKLRFFCEFTAQEPDFEEVEPQEKIDDQFNIVEVRIDESATGGVDKFYSHSGAVMDATLYDLLMDMLDERGVDDDFINNMVNFATSYEYKLYLKFLNDLKSIINEK